MNLMTSRENTLYRYIWEIYKHFKVNQDINILKFSHCKYILLVLFDFSIVISSLIFMLPYCVVPENIHTPPTEGFFLA